MTTTAINRKRRFEMLVNEVHEPIERYLRRRTSADDAEEVLSDVLLALWRRVDSIPDDAPLPWCYGVARRALANHHRSNRRRLQLVARLEAQPRIQLHERSETDHPELAAAILELSAADRELVALWAWEGLEPREIAVVLETTPNAISLRLTRVKKRVAETMKRQNPGSAGHREGNWTGSKGHD